MWGPCYKDCLLHGIEISNRLNFMHKVKHSYWYLANTVIANWLGTHFKGLRPCTPQTTGRDEMNMTGLSFRCRINRSTCKREGWCSVQRPQATIRTQFQQTCFQTISTLPEYQNLGPLPQTPPASWFHQSSLVQLLLEQMVHAPSAQWTLFTLTHSGHMWQCFWHSQVQFTNSRWGQNLFSLFPATMLPH